MRTAEYILRIDEATRRKAKKEIFSSAYIEAIEDRRITEEEFDQPAHSLDWQGCKQVPRGGGVILPLRRPAFR